VCNRPGASKNVDYDADINRTWENIKDNIKISAKESPGCCELKQLKTKDIPKC
jgi:hypothetical protein